MNQLRKKITRSFISFCCSCVFIACSNDDSEKPLTTIDLLTSGKWYLESKFQKSITPCEKKGYFEFNRDGSFFIYNYAPGNEDCVEDEPLSGSYTLTNDESILLSTQDGSFELFIIAISKIEMTIISDEIYTLDKIEG